MTLGRCPLSIFCSRGTPPYHNPQERKQRFTLTLFPRQVGVFKSKNASPNDALFVPAGLDSFKEIELQVPVLKLT